MKELLEEAKRELEEANREAKQAKREAKQAKREAKEKDENSSGTYYTTFDKLWEKVTKKCTKAHYQSMYREDYPKLRHFTEEYNPYAITKIRRLGLVTFYPKI